MTYSSTVLADSPIRYYKLDDTGDQAADSSGNSYHGSYSNSGITLAQSGPLYISQTATNFTGASQHVALPSGLDPRAWTHLTVELWYKPNSTTSARMVANGHTDSDNKGFQFDVGNNSLDAWVGNGSAHTTTTASPTLSAGTWYHLAFVFDGSAGTIKIFVNGSQSGSTGTNAAVTTLSYDSANIWISGNPTYSGDYANGVIGCVAFYNAALSSTQINTHYTSNSTASAYNTAVLADSPAAYYKLNDPPSTSTATDSSGSGYDGTYTSGPTQAAAGPFSSSTVNATAFNNGLVELPRTLDSTGWSALTVELWWDPASNSSEQALVSSGDPGSDHNGFEMRFGAGSDNLYVRVGNGSQAINYDPGGLSIPNGTWKLLAFTYDGSTGSGKLFINGSQVGTTSTNAAVTSIADDGYPISIGRNPKNNNSYANGSISRVAIYHSTLSSTRLLSHYNHRGYSGDYDTDVLADSPVGYYKLDESSASMTLTDSGSQAHDGTLNAGTERLAGPSTMSTPNVLQFDRTPPSYATMPTTSLPTGNSAWSVEGLFWTDALNSTWQMIASFGAESTGQSAFIAVNDFNHIAAGTWGTQNVDFLASSTTPSTQTWHHLVCTWDGTSMKTYYDGSQLGSTLTPGSRNITLSGARIGFDPTGGATMAFNGRIGHVAIYNTALSSAQVTTHYNAFLGGTTWTIAASVTGTATATDAIHGTFKAAAAVTGSASASLSTAHYAAIPFRLPQQLPEFPAGGATYLVTASVTGGASASDAIAVTHSAAASVTGTATASDSLRVTHPIAASITGAASASGAVEEFARLSASVTGGASASLTAAATHRIAASVTGGAALSGGFIETHHIGASVTGLATVSASLLEPDNPFGATVFGFARFGDGEQFLPSHADTGLLVTYTTAPPGASGLLVAYDVQQAGASSMDVFYIVTPPIQAFAVNGVVVPAPETLHYAFPPQLGYDLSAIPVQQGWSAMTWSWSLMTDAEIAQIMALYSTSGAPVLVTYPNELGFWVQKRCYVQPLGLGTRQGVLHQNVTLTFSHVSSD